MAKAAREQSRVLSALPSGERSDMLRRIASALEDKVDDIMAANHEDVQARLTFCFRYTIFVARIAALAAAAAAAGSNSAGN